MRIMGWALAALAACGSSHGKSDAPPPIGAHAAGRFARRLGVAGRAGHEDRARRRHAVPRPRRQPPRRALVRGLLVRAGRSRRRRSLGRRADRQLARELHPVPAVGEGRAVQRVRAAVEEPRRRSAVPRRHRAERHAHDEQAGRLRRGHAVRRSDDEAGERRTSTASGRRRSATRTRSIARSPRRSTTTRTCCSG